MSEPTLHTILVIVGIAVGYFGRLLIERNVKA